MTKTLTRCGITFIHFETEDGMVQSIRADWTDHDAIYGKGPDTRSKCLAYYEDLVDLNTAVKKMLNR